MGGRRRDAGANPAGPGSIFHVVAPSGNREVPRSRRDAEAALSGRSVVQLVEREANTLPVTCPCFRAEGRGLSDLETRVRFSPALPDLAVDSSGSQQLGYPPQYLGQYGSQGRVHHSSASSTEATALSCWSREHRSRVRELASPVATPKMGESLATPLPALPSMQCGPKVEGYRSRGFNSRLAHVVRTLHRLEWVAASRLSISRKSGHLAISGQVPSALTHPLERSATT